MMPFRTILFPTDFSKAVIEMVPYVREMGERFNANIIVLHAFDLVRDYDWASNYETTCEPGDTAIPYTPGFEELRNQRQHQLEEFARDQFPNVGCTARIQDGDVASVIELIAQSENADLVVMPTRGLGRFRRLLLGSVTAKVLHDVSCPVLTGAHELRPALAPTRGYRSIVCAVELNGETDAVLKAAGFLAQTYRARLCLVHMQARSSPEHDEKASAESLSQAFRRALNADEGKTQLDAKVCVFDASIPEGIRRAAIEEQADLVVVGRGHEKGNLSRMWSHLYTIIRESPCPVLSV
jgi:nucleotide-binding universal stress UspA family protein